MKSPGNFVILLETGAAPQNLWQPKLSNGTLHMANLALSWSWSLDPLRRFPSNAAYHVGMGQSLRSPLLRLHIEGGRNRLCNARVQRRCPTGDNQVAVDLVARGRTPIAIPGPGTDKRSMCVE